MWTCMGCETRNPDDSLQCTECGQVDPLASREELAVWQGALEAEQKSEPVRPPRIRGGVVVAILLIIPIVWKSIVYSRSAAEARRFVTASACHGSGGLGMPSPPCSAEPFRVYSWHKLGYGDDAPKGTRPGHPTSWYFFVADLIDANGRKRDAGMPDQATLDTLVDDRDVTGVEYEGKIVALSSVSGYYQTTDNPSIIASMDRTELIEIVCFAGVVALVFLGIDASGRYAARRLRQAVSR